jgi:hypothetical protein
MHVSHTAFLLTVLCMPSAGFAAQSAAGGGQTQNAPGQNAQAAPNQNAPAQNTPVQDARPAPSGLLQPSLDGLQHTLGALQVEKWKKGTVRDETGANINSILKDLQSTLPPLLKDADAAPRTMSNVLPVSRNVDALYDVLLRVVDGARIAGPGDQLTQLMDAMTGVEKARHALDDQIQEMAAAQEKQVIDLQGALKAQVVPVCPVAAPPPPAPAPAKKATPKKKRKPAATPQTANPQPAGTPQPSGSAKPNPSN